MKLGVTFPHHDFGADRDGIRGYVEAARDLGYDYFLAYDHVLGADISNRPGWTGYTKDDRFHEIFTLFAYVSALAPEMEIVSSVVILPQRQTALVAKQAAQIDIFTGGNFRLGVGVGWNAVEYEALGEDFTTRGRREDEQIALLRRYWTEPVLSFQGEFDRVTEAGLNPMPIQQPIPIWIGGVTEIPIKRAATVGDGWFPMGGVDEAQRERLALLRRLTEEAGRDSKVGGNRCSHRRRPHARTDLAPAPVRLAGGRCDAHFDQHNEHGPRHSWSHCYNRAVHQGCRAVPVLTIRKRNGIDRILCNRQSPIRFGPSAIDFSEHRSGSTMAGSKTARVIPAPGAMVSPQAPGMVPDWTTVPTHTGEATPAAQAKVRPLSQYGSAESLAEVFTKFGDAIQPTDFEQADASYEEVRKQLPSNLTPRRPRPPLGQAALEGGAVTPELTSGE